MPEFDQFSLAVIKVASFVGLVQMAWPGFAKLVRRMNAADCAADGALIGSIEDAIRRGNA